VYIYKDCDKKTMTDKGIICGTNYKGLTFVVQKLKFKNSLSIHHQSNQEFSITFSVYLQINNKAIRQYAAGLELNLKV